MQISFITVLHDPHWLPPFLTSILDLIKTAPLIYWVPDHFVLYLSLQIRRHFWLCHLLTFWSRASARRALPCCICPCFSSPARSFNRYSLWDRLCPGCLATCPTTFLFKNGVLAATVFAHAWSSFSTCPYHCPLEPC